MLLLQLPRPHNAANNFMKNLIQLLRDMFVKEWIWRLFLSLQALGVFTLIYADVSAGDNWSFLPDLFDYRNQPQFEWAIFDGRYWTRHHHNWLFLFALLGPFLAAKAIDWMFRANYESVDVAPRQSAVSLLAEDSREIVNVGRVKSEVRQIVGKRIAGLVMKAAKDQIHPPRNQLFLLFDDGTYYEFYTHDCKIGTTGGVVRGKLDDVLSYMADTRVPILIEVQE